MRCWRKCFKYCEEMVQDAALRCEKNTEILLSVALHKIKIASQNLLLYAISQQLVSQRRCETNSQENRSVTGP